MSKFDFKFPFIYQNAIKYLQISNLVSKKLSIKNIYFPVEEFCLVD